MDRRTCTRSAAGALGWLLPAAIAAPRVAAQAASSAAPRAASRLSPTKVTRIRTFYPPNDNANGPQAFPPSNMVVLVDTDAGPRR